MAHDQEIVSSNPGTVNWMDVSDLLANTLYKLKIKVAKMGHKGCKVLVWRFVKFDSFDPLNPPVFKLGVATLFRVAKYFLRVAIKQYYSIRLSSFQEHHKNRPITTTIH